MSKTESTVTQAIQPAIEKLGYELVEVTYQVKTHTLTVYLDSPAGISLDDCERASLAIDPLLDALDPIPEAYTLNVSSAGLDRPIKTERDYARNTGREVEVKLYAPLDGSKDKVIEGVLLGRHGSDVGILKSDGTELHIDVAKIALMTQLIKFE